MVGVEVLLQLLPIKVQCNGMSNSNIVSRPHNSSADTILSENENGKYLSEALILASTNSHYDERLFIESRVQYMKIARSDNFVYTNCFFAFVLTFKICVHNML